MIAVLLAASALCAACSSPATLTPTQSPSQTPTLPLSTHAGPLIRVTLPPTWTETPTPLPTATLTPTPVTPTATLTAVPSLTELCDTFTVDYSFGEGHTFRWNETITMLFGTMLTAVAEPMTGLPIPITVRWLATHRQSGENLGVELAGGEMFGMELPVNRLPRPGYYDWTVAVYGGGIGEQCKHEGHFFVFRDDSASTAEAASEGTPEATAETTLEATSEPQPG